MTTREQCERAVDDIAIGGRTRLADALEAAARLLAAAQLEVEYEECVEQGVGSAAWPPPPEKSSALIRETELRPALRALGIGAP